MVADGGQECVDLEPARVGEPLARGSLQDRDGPVGQPLAQVLDDFGVGGCGRGRERVEPSRAPRQRAAKLVKVVGPAGVHGAKGLGRRGQIAQAPGPRQQPDMNPQEAV